MVTPRFPEDAEKLEEALGPLPEPMARSALIMVSGLPGTGKSTFSRRLAEQIPCVILESDSLRKTLFPTATYSRDESLRVFQASHFLLERLLRRGIRVIFDATNLQERHREQLYAIASRSGAKLIVIQVQAPPETVRERLQNRQEVRDPRDHSDADWSVYQRMRPAQERIRRNYFAVDTSRELKPVLAKVVRELRRP